MKNHGEEHDDRGISDCALCQTAGGAGGAAPTNWKTWTKIRTCAFFRRVLILQRDVINA